MAWFSHRSGYALFFGLSPSTGDAASNNHTTQRASWAFSQDRGYQALTKRNLFGFRLTTVHDLEIAVDQMGPDNERHRPISRRRSPSSLPLGETMAL